VRRADGWETIAATSETIRLDDGEPVEIETKTTSRGVFLEADPEAGLPARSVAWTGYEPGDQFAAILALARCRSVAEIPAAIAPWVFPGQNLVAADRAGHLLWTPIGRAPNRFGWDGRFPAPGWRQDVGWAGLHPAEMNPRLEDPDDGVLATANSFLPVAQPAWFEGDFDTPFRADRIRQALALRTDWSVESLSALEGDTVSLWARTLVGALGTGYSGDAEKARMALAAWDGDMTATGVPALFALFERALQRATFQDEATRAGIPRFGTRWRLLHLLRGEMSAAWWDDVATPAVEDRPTIFARALESAWRLGAGRWGERVADWRYAQIHQLTLDHPLGSLPLIGRWWNRGPFPVPGAATSVLAFGGPWRGDEQDVAYGPSMRWVSDAADPERTLVVMPGGQSGHPGDAHYADQIGDYLANRARPFPWSDAAVEAATVSRLKLVPAGDAR
jgi:penicillin amidase